MAKRGLFFSTLSALLLSACSFAGAMEPPPGSELTAAEPTVEFVAATPQSFDLANGAAIFAESCAACHGVDGAGVGEMSAQLPVVPLNFTDHAAVADRTPLDWYTIITQGNLTNLMPPWSNALSDQERWDVTAYLYTLSYSDAQAAVAAETLATLDATTFPDVTDPAALQTLSNAALATQLAEIAPAATQRELLTMASVLRTQASNMPVTVAAVEQESATISRENTTLVTGALAGITDANDLWVKLRAFSADGQDVAFENPVAADGSFEFELTDLPDGTAMIVQTEYEGVTYMSSIIAADGDPTYVADINVYPATLDTAALNFMQLNLILEPAANSVQVTQLLLFENQSQETVFNPDAPTFSLDIPLEAANLNLNESPLAQRVEIEGNRLHVNAAFPPSAAPYELLISYNLPMQDGVIDVRQPQLEAAEITRLLIPAETLALSSELLQRTEPVTIADTTYAVFESEALTDGQLLRYRLAKDAASRSLIAEDGDTTTLVGGVLLVLVVLLGTILWLRQELVNPVQQRDKLLGQLAALDLQKDTLAKADYIAQRNMLKSDLLALVQQHADLIDAD